MSALTSIEAWWKQVGATRYPETRQSYGGLVVHARLERMSCPTGKRVSDNELRELNIETDELHGDWNHVIRPRTEMP